MKNHCRIVCAALLSALLSASISLEAQPAAQSGAEPASAGERLSLDRGWLFHEGDIPFPVITGHQASYDNAKAGSSSGAASPEYDDSSWKNVNLPHDWAVAQPFDPKANEAQGYRARGMGWYRKYFRLDPADRGKYLELQVDACATHCTIWVNGVLSQRNFSGYNSVYLDITPIARFGNDVNIIAIQVDANAMEGWWYEGAGLYRHAWLVKRNPVHIETDGVFANPVRVAGQWTIPVETTLYSSSEQSADVTVESTLLDPAGKPVVTGQAAATVLPLHETIARYALAVPSPELWSPDHPALYSVHTVVRRGGAIIDELTTRCGFRTIRFDANTGFYLNDKPVKLMGTANHQDSAGVGVAVPDSLWEFRLRRLKEMGSNAYRCAHNAPASEFLDAADRIGMLVMDENRNFGASPELIKQLTWEIRRDRNHPSVILWSVFNEEPSQGTEMGYELVRRMSATVKTLDTTRPVTAAQSNSTLNRVNASQAADVAGFNYVWREYDPYQKINPDKPMFSSEDTSTIMTRDTFISDRKLDLADSYDDQVLPWGLSHRDAWKEIATRPFVAGTMVWTGFDYRGEPQPFHWPAAGSSFGIMDLCGFPKAAYWIHQAQWMTAPMVHLVPHWNWAGSEGKPIKVMVFSNAQTVELRLNGKKVAAGPVDKYQMATFEVPYAPGRLEAVASNNGSEAARFAVETTGPAVAVRLVPDRASLAGDGDDAQPVTVEEVDAQGRVVPDGDALVRFTLDGPGALIGLNNGDPTNHESEKGTQHLVFHGLAQIIVQSAPRGSGVLTLHATADGLSSGESAIAIQPATARPAVPELVNPPLIILGWKRSPVTMTPQDPNQQLLASDMNSWGDAHPGSWLPPFRNGRYAVYRAHFTPRSGAQQEGGTLILHEVVGKVQVWADGKLIGERSSTGKADMAVTLAPGPGERTVSVLIEAPVANEPAGLGGVVTVE
jgi:beta-galactosidase